MTVNETKDHKFDGEGGGVYGKFWRKEWEGENVIILNLNTKNVNISVNVF